MSKSTSFRVSNESSQRERREILRNQREVEFGTYHNIAMSEAGAVGGRFAAEAKQRVTAATPMPRYPTLPSNSPWASDPVPAEEPLGVDLSAAPIVGEAFEVEKSLGGMHDNAGRSPPAASPDLASGEPWRVGRPSDVAGSSGSPPLSKRRKRS